MHFVRKLNFFKIDKPLISLFYQSIVNSVISFCICAWGGNTAERDIFVRLTGLPDKLQK